MNTYKKFAPSIFIAKCDEKHEAGEIIQMTTRHGKTHEVRVYKFMKQIDDSFYHSVIRLDGINAQTIAQRKAERLKQQATNAERRSDAYYQKSNKDADFLCLGEPIKVGHHSERRHRKIIEQAQNNAFKSIEEQKKAEELNRKAENWKTKTKDINLSMPESLEYYAHLLDEAKEIHNQYKTGERKREHSYSLTYARKKVKDLEKKVNLAKLLWEK